jgi:RHS repeat-associated protein
LTDTSPGENYTYDGVGNRLTGPLVTDTMSYDAGNEQLNINSTQYAYDLNGNRIQKTESGIITNYTYDDENRLVRITKGSDVITYAYDPFGRRIEKNVNGVITRYLYDQGAIIAAYDSKGSVTARYIHGLNIDEPLAIQLSKKNYFYHTDGLGSIVTLTNSSGSTAQTYSYDSFGNNTPNGSISQPFTFTAREYDSETGLYFYRARYYDPKVGRFVTKDPIGFEGGDYNLYNYVGGNPVNNNDPYGLFQWVNPITYWRDLYNYSHTQRIWGHGKYPGEKNSSMRHCVVSCMVASNFGIAGARIAGAGNELQGLILHDIPNIVDRVSGNTPWAFQWQDFMDNERGFNCSKKQRCKDDGNIEKNCIACCQGN